jgi:GTP-binding protein
MHAEFILGAARPAQFPPGDTPEVAFAGRSNVGKSSLLNRLTGRRRLARVSKTPGRTQQVNFFAVDGRLVLVDLPGYGFARVPLELREGWHALVTDYLVRRRQLRAVVVIVDARRGLQDDDAALLDFLDEHRVRAILVATKIDKIGRSRRAAQMARIASRRPGAGPIPFSSLTGEGVEDLWRAVRAAVD